MTRIGPPEQGPIRRSPLDNRRPGIFHECIHLPTCASIICSLSLIPKSSQNVYVRTRSRIATFCWRAASRRGECQVMAGGAVPEQAQLTQPRILPRSGHIHPFISPCPHARYYRSRSFLRRHCQPPCTGQTLLASSRCIPRPSLFNLLHCRGGRCGSRCLPDPTQQMASRSYRQADRRLSKRIRSPRPIVHQLQTCKGLVFCWRACWRSLCLGPRFR